MVFRKSLFITILVLIPMLLFTQQEKEYELPERETQEETQEVIDTETEETEVEVEVEIIDTPPKELEFTLEDIMNYIEADKEKVLPQNSMSQINYHNMIRFGGFRFVRPFLPTSAYNAKLTNLGNLNPNINQYSTIRNINNGMPVIFDSDTYPYEVSLTRLYAGMGELDKDFADITFRKDNTFSINNLSIRGDFKAINDYTNKNVIFPNQNYNKTSDAFFQLDYSLYEIDISTVYLSSNLDVSTHDYYIYDHNTKNMVHDSLTLNGVNVGTKYIYVGILQSENYISTSPKIIYSSQAYLLGVRYKNEVNNIDVAYQKNYDKYKGNHPDTQEYKDDIYSLKYSLRYPFNTQESIDKARYALTSELSLYDQFCKMNNYTQLSANLYKNIFIIGEASYNDYIRPQIPFFRFENYVKHSYKGGLGYYALTRPDRFWIDANIIGGQKEVIQFKEQADSISEKYVTISNEVNANLLLVEKYLININHTLEYDDFKQPFYLLPLYTNITDCSITLLMQNNNRLSLGTKISLISEVKNAQEIFIPANHCIDAYLKIGITKVFDIKLVLNNISRRQYYGNDLLDDFHFTSMMTWYFIN